MKSYKSDRPSGNPPVREKLKKLQLFHLSKIKWRGNLTVITRYLLGEVSDSRGLCNLEGKGRTGASG